MAKRRMLATRAFGAEPGLPELAVLAEWIEEHRGRAADIITYRLDQSLAPQVSAEVGLPCAGGRFYTDRILHSISGIHDHRAVQELHVDTSAVTEDAAGIVVRKKGAWCAIPAPLTLGIEDAHYGDEDEWNGAISGAYRTIMRAMRDTGVAGHVLITDHPAETELEALARQKVFFYAPAGDRRDLATLLEYQTEVAVAAELLPAALDLLNEYEIWKIFIINPDPPAIRLALSHLDPDRVVAGGYCTGDCQKYWVDLVSSAAFTA